MVVVWVKESEDPLKNDSVSERADIVSSESDSNEEVEGVGDGLLEEEESERV